MVVKEAGLRDQSVYGAYIFQSMFPSLIMVTIGLQCLGYWRFYINNNLQWTTEGIIVGASLVLFDVLCFTAATRCASTNPGFVYTEGPDAC